MSTACTAGPVSTTFFSTSTRSGNMAPRAGPLVRRARPRLARHAERPRMTYLADTRSRRHIGPAAMPSSGGSWPMPSCWSKTISTTRGCRPPPGSRWNWYAGGTLGRRRVPDARRAGRGRTGWRAKATIISGTGAAGSFSPKPTPLAHGLLPVKTCPACCGRACCSLSRPSRSAGCGPSRR